jgi:hypothetical protein
VAAFLGELGFPKAAGRGCLQWVGSIGSAAHCGNVATRPSTLELAVSVRTLRFVDSATSET